MVRARPAGNSRGERPRHLTDFRSHLRIGDARIESEETQGFRLPFGGPSSGRRFRRWRFRLRFVEEPIDRHVQDIRQPEQPAGRDPTPAGFEALDGAVARIQEEIEQATIDPEFPPSRGEANRHPAVDRVGDEDPGSRQEGAIERHGMRVPGTVASATERMSGAIAHAVMAAAADRDRVLSAGFAVSPRRRHRENRCPSPPR